MKRQSSDTMTAPLDARHDAAVATGRVDDVLGDHGSLEASPRCRQLRSRKLDGFTTIHSFTTRSS
jgi:hypothetical protein